MTSSRQSHKGRRAQGGHEPQSREGIDLPCGPPPEEDPSRCPGCGAEARVHEAIMDVAVGAATFRGA